MEGPDRSSPVQDQRVSHALYGQARSVCSRIAY